MGAGEGEGGQAERNVGGGGPQGDGERQRGTGADTCPAPASAHHVRGPRVRLVAFRVDRRRGRGPLGVGGGPQPPTWGSLRGGGESRSGDHAAAEKPRGSCPARGRGTGPEETRRGG